MQLEQIQFKPGVELAEDGARVGVTLLGKTQWSRNAVQAGIVRQVLLAPKKPETYAAELAREHNLPPDSTKMMFHLLDFILDFKDYLQSQ